MKRLVLCVPLLAFVLLAACGSPITPTPVVTPTTNAPTVVPTSNFRATENAIVSHVFATLTASAPTPTRVPAVPPTAAPTPRPPTNTPRPAAPRTSTPLPLVPAPLVTVDIYLSQIPKGQGGVLVANYIGNQDATFTLNGVPYQVPPNSKRLITIVPGTYNYSVTVPGIAEVSGSDVITVPMGQYVTYSIAIKQ